MACQEDLGYCQKCGLKNIILMLKCRNHRYCETCYKQDMNQESNKCIQCQSTAGSWLAPRASSASNFTQHPFDTPSSQWDRSLNAIHPWSFESDDYTERLPIKSSRILNAQPSPSPSASSGTSFNFPSATSDSTSQLSHSRGIYGGNATSNASQLGHGRAIYGVNAPSQTSLLPQELLSLYFQQAMEPNLLQSADGSGMPFLDSPSFNLAEAMPRGLVAGPPVTAMQHGILGSFPTRGSGLPQLRPQPWSADQAFPVAASGGCNSFLSSSGACNVPSTPAIMRCAMHLEEACARCHDCNMLVCARRCYSLHQNHNVVRPPLLQPAIARNAPQGREITDTVEQLISSFAKIGNFQAPTSHEHLASRKHEVQMYQSQRNEKCQKPVLARESRWNSMPGVPRNRIQSSADPSRCKVEGGLRIRNADACFLVCLQDSHGDPVSYCHGDITVQICLEGSSLTVASDIKDYKLGLYKVEYKLEREGKYQAFVKVFGQNIVNSPLIFNYPVPKVVGTIGKDSSFAGNGHLEKPWGIVVHENRVIVADRTSCTVQVFDRNGAFLQTVGQRLETSGQSNGLCEFFRPAGITVNSLGCFIITDKDNHRVKVYNRHFGFLLQFGSRGSNNDQFDYPFGVAVNEDNGLFIADSKNNRVVAYSKEFQFLRKSGFCKNPRDVACCKEFVIVGLFDSGNLAVLRQNLEHIHTIGARHIGRPQGIAVDVHGDVIVVESTRHKPPEPTGGRRYDNSHSSKLRNAEKKGKEPRISVFKVDYGGNRIFSGGSRHISDALSQHFTSTEKDSFGSLNEPCGVCVTEKGEIFVVDSLNHRVLVWV